MWRSVDARIECQDEAILSQIIPAYSNLKSSKKLKKHGDQQYATSKAGNVMFLTYFHVVAGRSKVSSLPALPVGAKEQEHAP
jgi:hypothetical protein